ncbi:MAG: tetratricopeptide repeat protein [Prevotella sp.]|nr:tetratricopeptide repeat protein [Prevotella sp.]
MEAQTSFKRIFHHIKAHNLSDAIDELEIFLATHPHQVNSDRLHAIRTDLQLMADYWKRGFKDPQLPSLYQKLMQRMYVLCANIRMQYNISQSSYLTSLIARVRLSARDFSPLNIRDELETFVSEIALLELEPEHQRAARQEKLYAQHQQAMVVLFSYLFTSDQWTDSQAASMEEMLLSPTIDSNDQQLMVSGIMLSLLEHFDMGKFRTLIHVYERAQDEQVRQRALVGWVLAIDSPIAASVYPEQITLVEKLVEQEQCCRELVELQQQFIMTMNAEEDQKTIQREIMPDLMDGQHLRMTRNGIEETEEDPMQDILNPDESERKMAQVEESYQRMMAMQKQGSDIYFGGFSQMKRFAFFNELSNWFVPYSIHHPEVTESLKTTGGNHFLQTMMKNGPFCNSDKYSFTLAFQQVLNQIPQNIREMLDKGEAKINEVDSDELNKPSYIRLLYIQDLYRFYRLFSQKNRFVNPFNKEEARYLFCADPIFTKTHLETSFNEVVAFLLKRKRTEEAARVLRNYGEARRDFQFWMMAGYILQHHGKNIEPIVDGYDDLLCYQEALKLLPDNEKALVGYGRALFVRMMYQEALETYDKLLTINPDRKSYRLNRAVSLTNLGQYAGALKELYRLNYESPDDQNVSRVLAWTLVCEGKYDAAVKIYNDLLKGDVQADDLLNYGYCLWLSGHVDEAADCFHRFLKESAFSREYILQNEAALLKEKGITEPEQQLMLYLL